MRVVLSITILLAELLIGNPGEILDVGWIVLPWRRHGLKSCSSCFLLLNLGICIPTIIMGQCVTKILCCSWCFQQEIKDDESNQHIDFASGNVHLITTKESWDEKLSQAIKDGKIVIANFSATWCGPCRVIAPFYSELSEKHPSLMFLLVDVDELTEFSTSWDIKATPTFFFLKDGNQVDKLVGANKPELQKKITAILDSIDQSQK
ncbi:thioredoxin H9 isoform X1 [Eucalyptus grandis]|uniref:thioredoxin H9 isoform X1 n=2 Tax=Eucalyptus grandis TaxID=71139 RepID=UPI00192E8312|nr:thioredoxin H9 isoform X1 [Eucalyptus grandis]